MLGAALEPHDGPRTIGTAALTAVGGAAMPRRRQQTAYANTTNAAAISTHSAMTNGVVSTRCRLDSPVAGWFSSGARSYVRDECGTAVSAGLRPSAARSKRLRVPAAGSELRAGDRALFREVGRTYSYLSAGEALVHFGLGPYNSNGITVAFSGKAEISSDN